MPYHDLIFYISSSYNIMLYLHFTDVEAESQSSKATQAYKAESQLWP